MSDDHIDGKLILGSGKKWKSVQCGNAGPEGTCIDIAKGVVYKL